MLTHLSLTPLVVVQAQHNSASDLPALSASHAPSGALPPSTTASGQLPEGVPTSRLLATIHSGIPSTDDDGMYNQRQTSLPYLSHSHALAWIILLAADNHNHTSRHLRGLEFKLFNPFDVYLNPNNLAQCRQSSMFMLQTVLHRVSTVPCFP